MSDPGLDEAAERDRGIQPRALIVTVYGLYAREVGGWLSIQSLIRLMSALGIDEAAVRSSISRLKRRGLLVAEKVDGAAGYGLSARAREILREGDRRIFERPRAGTENDWLVVVFSVPESERARRHQLRSRLSWLGFGAVASGVWIAPAHVEREARDMLASNGLAEYADLFRAEHVAFGSQSDQAASWWDLAGLERMYAEFVAAYRPVLAAWRQRRRDDVTAFADYVRVLTFWRRLPYLDPGLPASVLPDDWRGLEAADIFFELHERLAAAAHRHVKAVTAVQPARTA